MYDGIAPVSRPPNRLEIANVTIDEFDLVRYLIQI
jgi:hypothetical protein